jgi:hypothetical protein
MSRDLSRLRFERRPWTVTKKPSARSGQKQGQAQSWPKPKPRPVRNQNTLEEPGLCAFP